MSTEKLATKSDLHEMYNRMLPYMGGMPEVLANKFSKSDLYSDTEKIIGCWHDGRPIYQKTVNVGTLPNATTKEVAHNISNLGYVIEIIGTGYNPSTGQYFTVPTPFYAGSLLTEYDVYAGVTSSKIQVITGRDWSAATTCFITIKYTKTTDAANSFIFSDETDFSTSEKIIGTWLDGSYIYQKTISTGQLPNTGSTSTAHNISNLKYIVDYFGVAKRSTDNTFISLVFTNPDAVASQVALTVNSTNIVISTGMDRSNFTESYVTIRYIKTS